MKGAWPPHEFPVGFRAGVWLPRAPPKKKAPAGERGLRSRGRSVRFAGREGNRPWVIFQARGLTGRLEGEAVSRCLER